jgi:hypothetical protein
MSRTPLYWSLLLAVACAPAAECPYTSDDCAAAIERAATLRLGAHPYWRVLLHMANGITGTRSRVDDPRFFLAANGKSDPEAELRADLSAFFAPSADDRDAAANRFPARLEWLCAELELDRERLPRAHCAEFEDVFAKLAPRSVALVFPSAYMNTPASMFGHTMVMVRSQYDSALLSQSINYAAVTPERNGIVFAFKGIFGLYHGYYSLQPYYQKVQEYNDIDQRDIWEYELNFTAAEIRRMLLHVWEMRGIYSAYFFFDENCSFNLMYLLDAARPGLALNETIAPWVIPLDTVKHAEEAHLIAQRTYRPSRSARVRWVASQLAGEQRAQAHALAAGAIKPAEALQRPEVAAAPAKVLDLAAEYLQSLRGRKKISQADYQPRMLAILGARSKIDAPASADGITAPPPPDRGHPSTRISAGIGRSGGDNFAEFSFRPAYHDLLDPPDGYLVGSQIEFMSVTGRCVTGRWYEDDDHPELERVDVIRLRSFTPRDEFYPAKSWKIDTGIIRQQMGEDGDWHRHAYVNPGVGLTYTIERFGTVFCLLEGDARVDFHGPEASFGAGPTAGAILPIGPRWLLNPYARLSRYFGHAQDTNWRFGCEQRLIIRDNLSLGADVSRSEEWDFLDTAAALRLHYYF